MSHPSSEVAVFKPTHEVKQLLGNPALVGGERREDYDKFFASVAAAVNPTDFVGWLLVKDVTDCCWDICRERTMMAEIIKHHQKEVVASLLPELAPPGQLGNATYRTFQANVDLTLWANDPQAREQIEKALAAKGHSVSAILAQAYMRGAADIDAIDRRIAGYERRRNVSLKESGLWSERLLKQLDRTTDEIIDGEFTEAAGFNDN